MYYNPTIKPGSFSPTANIAVKRNRLKQYGETVYLKTGTHFEIELFNPKTVKVLAKIFLDGIEISSAGIVIKPGQRVFLERWIDEPKKFLFETYEVDQTSSSAKEAIALNGRVRVQFYEQLVTPRFYPSYGLNSEPVVGLNNHITWTYDSSNQPVYGGSTQTNITSFSNDVIGNNTSIYTSMNFMETGRAEKGESSNQTFDNDSDSYDSWTCNTVHIQILPESQKPVEVKEIRNYCTDCGSRLKKSSWKFCPTCGTKI